MDLSNPTINFNDKIASFRIGKGVKVKFCDNVDCSGDWDKVIEIVGPYNVGDVGYKWLGKISYVKTEIYDEDDLDSLRV